MATKRCFRCGHKMDTATGLCTNEKCTRSKPVTTETSTDEKAESSAEESEA